MSFQRYTVHHPENFFQLLHYSVKWEDFSKGRQIAVLHQPEEDSIPVVRTTTVYETPSQPFSPTHETVIKSIQEEATSGKDLKFNNAMLEVYDARYTTMTFHTDQALDLDPDSYICLFSCYEKGADAHPRVLTIKNKNSGEQFQVELLHHSAVIFSTAMNRDHLHKIEGRDLPKDHDNRWMGFTLRLSKTFVTFVDGEACVIRRGESKLRELTLATDEERKAFYRYKGLENKETDFEYPEICYTISPSDLMPVASANKR